MLWLRNLTINVKDIEKIDSFNEQMTGLGYECMGELDMKGRY